LLRTRQRRIVGGHGGLSVNPFTDATDRRSSDRFPIERKVRFKILSNRKHPDELGAGQTVNMSSTGLLFTSDLVLMPGRKMEVSISWPAQLNSKTPLQLVTRGTVVRSEDSTIALEIQKHEFHTQSASAAI
jgi:hypothetical protein